MIPDYQAIMLPLLQLLADGREHSLGPLAENLAQTFQLTEEERNTRLQSGQLLFRSRISWAKTYLKSAGLVDSPHRATYRITEQGRQVLAEKPAAIDRSFLLRFPSFVEFVNKSSGAQATERTGHPKTEAEFLQGEDNRSPEERMELAYQQIRASMAGDLLNKVLESSPAFFEQLVVDLLVKMGYGGSLQDAGKALGRSGDEGIDGTIKEDRLGLDVIYIQAKRWKPGNQVGRPGLQGFVGALAGKGAKKGIFITTSGFTREAVDYARQMLETKIVLIDGDRLAQLMLDFNVGCTVQQVFEIKKIDHDYFGPE
jgi:restriction system protein